MLALVIRLVEFAVETSVATVELPAVVVDRLDDSVDWTVLSDSSLEVTTEAAETASDAWLCWIVTPEVARERSV